ncbi:MAG TPA: hypothetical protein VJJ80_02140 [Patescibacteria group bacterium]|nr:hypothetical protein [Patescibacteria group bacterium]
MNSLITFATIQSTKIAMFPILQAPHAGGSGTEYDLWDVVYLIGNVINVALTLAGAIAIIYIIIGGYKYIISAGNPDAIAQAKSTILWAVIGLVICFAALAIINFAWGSIIGGLPPQAP